MTLLIRSLLSFIILLVLAQSSCVMAQAENDKTKKQQKSEIDWGDWNTKSVRTPSTTNKKEAVKAELRNLDNSAVLNENQGVTTQKVDPAKIQNKQKKIKNVKAMMKELEKLEAELKQEIRNDSEF